MERLSKDIYGRLNHAKKQECICQFAEQLVNTKKTTVQVKAYRKGEKASNSLIQNPQCNLRKSKIAS